MQLNMKGSLVTRFAVVAAILTAAVAAATATVAAPPSHAADVNLHADDSKISRIRPMSFGADSDNDPEENEAADLEARAAQRRNGLSGHRDPLASVSAHKHAAAKSSKSVNGIRKMSNHEVLRSLGMAKLNIPSSHHRKRLAVESRHHSRPDDSHMYIIKLPPNPAYYTKTSGHDRNAIQDTKKKVTVDFMSNGKPGRIYHWNLPVLKRMLGQEGGHSGAAGSAPSGRTAAHSRLSNDISELIDIRHIPTWTKPWDNEAGLKAHHHRTNDRLSSDDSLGSASSVSAYKQKSPTFYAPRPKMNGSVQKHFPGNGKPKSFYVIKGKSQTPHYQKLIP